MKHTRPSLDCEQFKFSHEDGENPALLDDRVPLNQAAQLVPGKVMHARLNGPDHRFTYSVVSLLLDIDKLSEADRMAWGFGINRRALVSFHESDHGPCDGTPLRAHIDALMEEAGLEKADRLLLLAYPRVLGYVFNPLSIYFAYDVDGDLTAAVYEVRNTFGDLHTYVLPVEADHLSPAGLRQACSKSFYVSPFMGMTQRYHFRINLSDQRVLVRILETDGDGPSLAATFAGTSVPLNDTSIRQHCLRQPWLAVKVMAGIHWEALKLWIKGARYHGRSGAHRGHSVERGDATVADIRQASN